MSPLAAVILAGGRGERLGGADKALLEDDHGRRLIDAVIAAVSSVATPVVIASGSRVIPGLTVPQVRDRIADGGPLIGLVSAMSSLPAEATVAVVAVDMPAVSGAVLQFLASRLAGAGAAAAVPRIDGHLQPLHAVVGAPGREALADAVAAGGRSVIGALRGLDLLVVDAEELVAAGLTASFASDIDLPEDLGRWSVREVQHVDEGPRLDPGAIGDDDQDVAERQ